MQCGTSAGHGVRLNLFSSKSKCIAVGGFSCRVTIMCSSLLFFSFHELKYTWNLHGTDLHIKIGQFVQLVFNIRYITKCYSFMMSCFSCLVDVCWQWSEVLRCGCDNVTFSCHASQCSAVSSME